MKIVIIGPAYPLRGGIAHHTNLLYEELKKRHSVSLFTFRRQYPAFLFPGTTQHESSGALLQVPSEALIDSINPFTWIAVGLRLRAESPDLVIFAYSMPFFGPCYGTIAALARRRGKTTVLFLCHNIVPHDRRPGDILFTRFAFAFGDCFVVQSEAVQKDLLRFRPRARFALSPHPVYTLFGDPVPKQDARKTLGITEQRVLLFFGYIRQYKGLGVLLQAMKKLRERPEMRTVTLLVVGECYEDESRYRHMVEELGLSSCVRLVLEYVPQKEVATYFGASDVVVLPYLTATQSGIVQIAYNFNKPVIATSVGGLAEVMIDGKTGLVVPPNDPVALAGAIEKYYTGMLEQDFAAHVLEQKKKYSWDGMAKAIETLAARVEDDSL